MIYKLFKNISEKKEISILKILAAISFCLVIVPDMHGSFDLMIIGVTDMALELTKKTPNLTLSDYCIGIYYWVCILYLLISINLNTKLSNISALIALASLVIFPFFILFALFAFYAFYLPSLITITIFYFIVFKLSKLLIKQLKNKSE
jgi:hypothetical protein